MDPDATTLNGILKEVAVKSGDEVKMNLDLLGCKRYVKITPTISFTGGSSPAAADAAYAMVLGDPTQAPV